MLHDSPQMSRVREIIRTQIDRGRTEMIREKLDQIVENIYQSLPSGDYGRGDVRAQILSILDEPR